MLGKMKNVIIKVLCFLWITMISLTAAVPKDGGGIGINGFLAFGLWILCIFIMTKIRPWIVALVSTLIVVGIQIANNEITWAEFIKEMGTPIGVLVIILIILKLLDAWEAEAVVRSERIRNAQKRGEAHCPKCGSTSIQYYPTNQEYHCNFCGHEWW